MKKMNSLLMLLAIATASMTFTSCDDDPWHDPWYDGPGNVDGPGYQPGGGGGQGGDQPGGGESEATTADEADLLCGEWQGTMSYTYKNETGTGYDVASFDANMKFSRYKSGDISGTGVETDYAYDDAGNVIDTQISTFKWTILDNFDIKITFDASGKVFVLDSQATQKYFWLGYDDQSKKKRFYGYMIGNGDDAEGEEIRFNLEEVTSTSQAKTRAAEVSTNKSFGIKGDVPAIAVAPHNRLVKR